MARLESVKKAGFYATPTSVLDDIGALVSPTNRYYGSIKVFDPCAGEGEAVDKFRSLWRGRAHACEVEYTRHEKLKERVWNAEHADAFNLTWDGSCDVLYLNPPYDHDKEFKRLEQKWLQRFQHSISAGGLLLFVVPEYTLDKCDFSHFHDISIFRFPEPEYDAYSQVVLVARKSETPLPCELPEPQPLRGEHKPYSVNKGGSFYLFERPVDVLKIKEHYHPWYDDKGQITNSPVTYEGRKNFDLACIPKPAYMAAALSAGVFDGRVLHPNKDGLPPLLAKGTFKRAFIPMDDKTNKEGKVMGKVEIQRPELKVVALNLHTAEFHEFDPSTDPKSDDDISDFSCGDFIRHYSEDLRRALYTRCSILHDSTKDEPTSEGFYQRPYNAQGHAISSLLKCLDRDNCAWLMGQIGVGKCLGIGTPVLKYDGSVIPVEDVQEGDLLMGPDSKPRKVTGTTRGTGPLYRITPTKGDPWVCNDAHILTLVHTMSDDVFDIPLQKYLSKGNLREFKQFFPENGVDFPHVESPSIDPYFLGVCYGNGDIQHEYGDGFNLPKSCILGSKKTRRSFLAGLLDTNGYDHNKSYEIVQKRKRWAEDIHFLARSLGFQATLTEKYVELEPGRGGCCYRVAISGDLSSLPLRIPRKSRAEGESTGRRNKVNRTGISVEHIGDGEYAGFKLDGDGRFLLGDFTVTHNTSTSLNAAIARDAKRILVMVPPHLIPVWRDEQLPQIYPTAKVRVLSSISEVDEWAKDEDDVVIGLLSRETAKLSHAWEGIIKCPKCGSDSAESKEKNAKSRSTCVKVSKTPLNERAKLIKAIERLLPLKDSIIRRELRGFIDQYKEYKLPLMYLLHFLQDDDLAIKYGLEWQSPEMLSICRNRAKFHAAKETYDYKVPWYSRSSIEYESRWGTMIRHSDGSVSCDGIRAGSRLSLSAAISQLSYGARWNKSRCGEPLYAASPQPRRYPLAKYISKKYPNIPDFIILDEAHELANTSSAQAKSAQQLYNLRAPKIAMTGSTMNGYASTMFLPLWFFNDKFREEFDHGDSGAFVKKYGYIKRVAEDFDSSGDKIEFGSHSNCTRRHRTVGQAPGVLPSLLLRYFLRNTVTLHIEDLGIDLPSCSEHVIKLPMEGKQKEKYRHVEGALVRRIQEDKFSNKAGKLFGQMAMLPSCPDRITNDTGNTKQGSYRVEYPENTDLDGEHPIVAEVEGLDQSEVLPKEQALLDLVEAENSEGRNVLVLVWNVNDENTGGRSVSSRVCHLLGSAYLDAKKVTPKKRVDWINKHIVRKGQKVLVANPNAIKTGINNLIHFSTIVFYQNPGCSPEIRRQVRGRIVRVGQTKNTKIYTMLYSESAQEQEHKLLLHKVAISEYTDGLDPEAALKASGVGEETDLIGTNVGKALYKMLEKQGT